jgi:hypothetical protein
VLSGGGGLAGTEEGFNFIEHKWILIEQRYTAMSAKSGK